MRRNQSHNSQCFNFDLERDFYLEGDLDLEADFDLEQDRLDIFQSAQKIMAPASNPHARKEESSKITCTFYLKKK